MTGNNQQVADPRAYVGLGDCCNPRGRGLDEDGGDQDATHGDLSVRSVREGCPRSEIPQIKGSAMDNQVYLHVQGKCLPKGTPKPETSTVKLDRGGGPKT